MIIFSPTICPWIWIGVLVVCCFIEAFTMGLTTIWGGIASLPLIFIARTGLPFKWQILIFVIITLILIIFTRPFVAKKLNLGKNKTNVNSMIGQEVLITKAITQFAKGEAKAKNGVIWSVTTSDNSEIQKNTTAKVISVEGNTLCVSLN